MKITKELLKRHGLGLCTEAEKKAVEEWFEQHEYPSMHTSTAKRPRANRERIWSRLAQDRPQLDKRMSFEKAKNLVFLNSAMKYAAAACFLVGAFFFGRISVGTATASTTPKDPTADHLFIYGGDGAKGNLEGNYFKVGFNGKIKLYNNGISLKQIQVGDTSFNLKPHKYYFLSGNIEDPQFKVQESFSSGNHKEKPLKGYFSVIRNKE